MVASVAADVVAAMGLAVLAVVSVGGNDRSGSRAKFVLELRSF